MSTTSILLDKKSSAMRHISAALLSFAAFALSSTFAERVEAAGAEPGVSGAVFQPPNVPVGSSSELTISFSNSGSGPIPIG